MQRWRFAALAPRCAPGFRFGTDVEMSFFPVLREPLHHRSLASHRSTTMELPTERGLNSAPVRTLEHCTTWQDHVIRSAANVRRMRTSGFSTRHLHNHDHTARPA